MGTKEKQIDSKPTSGQIAEELAKLENDIAALAAQAEQAESRAVEKVMDSAAYEAASAEAASLRSRQAVLTQRVQPLRAAYEKARDGEYREHLARLKEESERLSAKEEETRREVRAARDAEKNRHEETIAALDRREKEAETAAREASNALHAVDLRNRLAKAKQCGEQLVQQEKSFLSHAETDPSILRCMHRVRQDMAANGSEREELEAELERHFRLLNQIR